MAMTHERLAVSSGLHTILTNYRFSGSPNLQNPQPTTSLLVFFWAPKMGIKSIMSQGSRLNHQTYPSWLIHVGNEMLPSMGSMKSPMEYSLKSQVQQVEVKSSSWSR